MATRRMFLSSDEKSLHQLFTVIGHGQQARTPSEKFAFAIAEAVGLTPESVIDGGVKTEESLLEKANGLHDGRVDQVADVKRFRVLFKHPSQIFALRDILGAKTSMTRFKRIWEDKGIHIADYKDNFSEPKEHGYIGFLIHLEADLKRGRKAKCEVQFMHEDMQLTDKVTHAIYEEKRKIERTAEMEGRDLTPTEEKVLESRKVTLRRMFEEDAKLYGLDILRSPNYEAKQQFARGRKSKQDVIPIDVPRPA